LDGDGDGIADQNDKCPTQAEVINGVADEDGCPDEGEQLVKVTETTVELNGMVFFGIGSDELFKRAFAVLDQLAAVLRNHQDMEIVVQGYADAEGSAAINMRLSKKRAEAVRKYLISVGINGDRIRTEGYGESHFRASNADPRSRSLNRRVTIRVLNDAQKNGATKPVPPSFAPSQEANDGIPTPLPEAEVAPQLVPSPTRQ
jgi:outer membrane protein OmpA-like peptidoglycan-associated protein